MNRIRSAVLSVCAGSLAIGSLVSCQPSAEKPNLEVGNLHPTSMTSGSAAAAAAPATQAAPVAKVRTAAGIAGVYDVRSFGAVGDGKTIDSPAINKAIEVASAAGGGTVRFPAGIYLSYSIRLKSNITIYLEAGSKILAANKSVHGGEGYDAPEPIAPFDRYQDFGHSHWHNSLIWGENVENITITGPGMIDGGVWPTGAMSQAGTPITVSGITNGLGGGGGGGRGRGGARGGPATQQGQGGPGAGGGFGAGQGGPGGGGGRGNVWTLGRGRGGGGGGGGRQGPGEQGANLQYPGGDTLAAGIGNKAIALKLCKNVTLSEFSVLRGGHFSLLATGVDNFTIDNLKIDTNRDGFDIDGCRNVRISNCSINSPADDAIVLKSTFGLGFARSCENITITNCMVCGGWEVGSMLAGTYIERAPGTGRIKFGTESNAGFKNIAISNCVFDRCQGLALEAVDGAVIDNISISNITMREIGSTPIFIRLGDRRRGPAPETPIGEIKHVNISDIVAQNRAPQYACIISGIPGHQIEDVRISNVRIIWPGGAPEKVTRQADSTEVDVIGFDPPENEFAYPEPSMFGMMPAYGFYIRHVKGIELNNIEMTYLQKDMRPPFDLNDVQVAEFNHIKAQHEPNVPLFNLKNVEAFRTHEVRGMPDTQKDKIEAGKF